MESPPAKPEIRSRSSPISLRFPTFLGSSSPGNDTRHLIVSSSLDHISRTAEKWLGSMRVTTRVNPQLLASCCRLLCQTICSSMGTYHSKRSSMVCCTRVLSISTPPSLGRPGMRGGILAHSRARLLTAQDSRRIGLLMMTGFSGEIASS